MAEEQTFEVLLREFRRVGVDPDTFSAMLAVRPEDAMRALQVLPDGAGPSAFLAQLRAHGIGHAAESSGTAVEDRTTRRRDKTA